MPEIPKTHLHKPPRRHVGIHLRVWERWLARRRPRHLWLRLQLHDRRGSGPDA